MTHPPDSNHDILTFPEEGLEDNYMAAATRNLYPISEEPSRENSLLSMALSPSLQALSLLVEGYAHYRDAVKQAGEIVFSAGVGDEECMPTQMAAGTDIMLVESIERQLNLILMAKIEGELAVVRDRAVREASDADREETECEERKDIERDREALMGFMRVVDEPL